MMAIPHVATTYTINTTMMIGAGYIATNIGTTTESLIAIGIIGIGITIIVAIGGTNL
jgi:hypothetical protein